MKAGKPVSAGTGRKAGQTMVFLIMALVLIAFIAFWTFDLHKIVYVKFLSQNAGDSAALAAARWQGTTLNLIGDLNILQAVALTRGDTRTAGAISELQARLCFVGPLTGLLAAQQAAKNNGIHNNDAFTARILAHAATVRTDYGRTFGPNGDLLFPEPYPQAWSDYAAMLELIAADGIAAGPDNAQFFDDYDGPHILLDPDFYDAVAGRIWCWFFHRYPNLLEDYSGFGWWPPLPDRLSTANPMNSEYFGLGLTRVAVIGSSAPFAAAETLRQDRNLGGAPIDVNAMANATSVWYCYDAGKWSDWAAFAPTNDTPFPATGSIKPQYDYAGADAAIRIEALPTRLTPGSQPAKIIWSAAAKPFGYLNAQDRPNIYGLVLPAFRQVRLIPVDASSAPAAGAFDLQWRDHIETHLPEYMRGGTALLDRRCWYCQQLITWESAAFRQSGVDWLRNNSGQCRQHGGGPGGGGSGGGTHRGH